MTLYRAEFHIHTVLSPCAGVEMIPPLIVQTACEKNINLIAITDHNASANVSAVIEAAKGYPLHVIPGVELETSEEVHTLCFFDEIADLVAFQEIIDSHLLPYPNNEDFFGAQLVVDAEGNFIKKDTRLLATATTLDLKTAFEAVHSLGGLMIPAHVDREANSLLTILGGVPPDIPFKLLEISQFGHLENLYKKNQELKRYHFIQDGDAHNLEAILGLNVFSAQCPTLCKILTALTSPTI